MSTSFIRISSISVLAKTSERHTKVQELAAFSACHCFEQRHEQSVSGEMKVVPRQRNPCQRNDGKTGIVRIFLLVASKTAESTKCHLWNLVDRTSPKRILFHCRMLWCGLERLDLHSGRVFVALHCCFLNITVLESPIDNL